MKDMTCRVALLRMQADGLITLPPSQTRSAKVKPHFPPTPATDPQASVLQPVHELGSLTLHLVTGTAPSRLWNEYIARYQYLGYTPMYLRGKTPLKPYSMFCTCSRICSISTFMSTERWVSSSAADLAPMVLASRCSS